MIERSSKERVPPIGYNSDNLKDLNHISLLPKLGRDKYLISDRTYEHANETAKEIARNRSVERVPLPQPSLYKGQTSYIESFSTPDIILKKKQIPEHLLKHVPRNQ